MTNHPGRPRALLRPVLLVALTALLVLLGTVPASAHDVLEGSDPADGTSVATAPSRITLTFSEEPTAGAATVTVVGPDGSTRYEAGAAAVEGERVSVGVNPLGPAGRYEVGYRVVSSDGHPIAGALSFTLTTPGSAAAPATGAPAVAGPVTAAPATEASPAAASSPAGDDGDGVPAWPFVLLAVVVVIGAVALVLRRRA